MKAFKTLKKISTDEYWAWHDNKGWRLSGTPDLLKADVTTEQLKSIGMLPPDSTDLELVEIFVMDYAERNSIKKGLIEEHPLGLLFFGKDIETVIEILKESSTHYVLEWKRNDAEEANRCQINIVCPTTSFANAYYHIGAQIGKEILSKRKDQ